MRNHFKYLKKEKGMTLIELLAVLVILGIVAAIAVPMIGNIISDSKDKAIIADAQQILSSAKLAYTNGDFDPVKSDDVITGGTVDYDVLNRYVDGIELEDGDKATFEITAGETKWTLTWSRLNDIKNKSYRADLGAGNDGAETLSSVSEELLNKFLKNE